MKESDIRPTNLMKKYSLLLNDDSNKLLNHKDKFVYVSCPACMSSNYKFEFEKRGFKFVLCKECETLFVNPRPSFEMLIDFYTNSSCFKFWNDEVFAKSENARRKKIFTPRALRVMQLCKKYGVDSKLLLDVGAGFGTFCEEIEKLNCFKKVVAIEPSAGLAKTCKRKGLFVVEKAVEEVEGLNANVITNFELIEHLFSPREFIKSCYKLLSKDGLLIITTPNIKGFDLLLLRDKSNNVMPPNHINYFNIKSLSLLLEEGGFEILEVLTPGKLDVELVRSKVVAGEYDITQNPFLKRIIIDEWEEIGEKFQKFLSENKLSSHLWVVAKKS